MTNEHNCRSHLPKPRRWRLGQVRSCPCGRLYACHRWGILAPRPLWMPVRYDRLAAIPPEKRDRHLEQMRAELRETDTEEAAS